MLSGFESWKSRKMEASTDDNNLTTVEVDVAVTTEVSDQQEIDETVASIESTVSAEEASEASVDTMEMLASLLRNPNHGLNLTMHAMLSHGGSVERALNIVIPGAESLSSVGPNTMYAEHIAAALEASAQSFWEKTKTFIKNVLDQIIRACNWVINKVASWETAVVRAGSSLDAIQSLDSEKVKDRKIKILTVKGFNESTLTDAAALTLKSVTDATSVIAKSNPPAPFTIPAEVLRVSGLKWEGDDLQKDADFKIEPKEVGASTYAPKLKDYKTGGSENSNAKKYAGELRELKSAIANLESAQKRILNERERTAISRSSTDQAKVNDIKTEYQNVRKSIQNLSKMSTAMVKISAIPIRNYITICAALRVSKNNQ